MFLGFVNISANVSVCAGIVFALYKAIIDVVQVDDWVRLDGILIPLLTSLSLLLILLPVALVNWFLAINLIGIYITFN